VDLVVESSRALLLVDAKSGATVAGDFFKGLDALAARAADLDPARPVERILVYGGGEETQTGGVRVVPWMRVPEVDWGDRH
jgi:hypothetical protein